MSHLVCPHTVPFSSVLALALLAGSGVSPVAADHGSSQRHGTGHVRRAASAAEGATRPHRYTVREVGMNGRDVFQPARLTIHRGDTVRWVDQSAESHNIVGIGAAMRVINRADVSRQPYTVTFRRSGTYG